MSPILSKSIKNIFSLKQTFQIFRKNNDDRDGKIFKNKVECITILRVVVLH